MKIMMGETFLSGCIQTYLVDAVGKINFIMIPEMNQHFYEIKFKPGDKK
jgi:hypothetical protein